MVGVFSDFDALLKRATFIVNTDTAIDVRLAGSKFGSVVSEGAGLKTFLSPFSLI